MHLINEFIKNENDAKKALIGTIFADGSLCKKTTPKGRASCEITHTARNIDYLNLKKEIFEFIPNCKCYIKEHNRTTKEKEYLLFRLLTNRLDWLTLVREDIYEILNKSRIKHLVKEYINLMSDLGLLLLYLDNGYLKAKSRKNNGKISEFRITFCLESFSIEELNYFREWLFFKYGVESRIYRHYCYEDKPNYGYRIWTNTLNTKKLMKIFDKFYDLVPSMRYKFVKYYPS